MFQFPRRSRPPSLAAIGALLAAHSVLAATLVSQAGRVQERLIHPFAARFQTPEFEPRTQPSGIVVLGGGFERTREGIRLSHRYPGAWIVITGATERDYAYARSHAADLTRLVIEPKAKSTFENARFTKDLVSPKPRERWLLVTSAAHMPRAVATFRGADFPVVPWPVHDEPADLRVAARQAAHEVLGLIGYRLMGRTREFWPAVTTLAPEIAAPSRG